MSKGQLQTLEPIIIVMMLALLVGLGLLFYIRINHAGTQQARSVAGAQEDFTTLARIVELPELACSSGATAKEYCIDLYKAKAFAASTQNNEQRAYYYTFFGASRITLEYIDDPMPEPIVLYENLKDTHVIQTRTFFAVLDPVTNERKFAVLKIERET
jgi:hypothetical protein